MNPCDVFLTRCFVLFFFKQKTAYEMRISDWSSDVGSSDLFTELLRAGVHPARSEAIFGCTPARSSSVKCVCRRAWKLTRRTFARSTDRKSVMQGKSV